MVDARGRAKASPRTKTLSWSPRDQAALSRLRSQVAATCGIVVTERDLVAAALRLTLRDPSGLGLARPIA
jgi:hypothetical protein